MYCMYKRVAQIPVWVPLLHSPFSTTLHIHTCTQVPALYLFFFYHARFLRPFRGAGSLLVLLPRRNNLMAPAPPPRAAPFFDVG